MKKVAYHKGIAMVELVFAIVIMGIVLMSAPQLISTAMKSTNIGIQQEGINEAASRINMILTYPWDENNTNDSCIPPVLHVTNGNPYLDAVDDNTSRRIGVDKNSSSHTFICEAQDLNASTLGIDGSDDIDDFTNDINLTIDNSGDDVGTDYIEKNTIKIVTKVGYITDDPYSQDYNNTQFSYRPSANTSAGTTTNIKEINVTLTSTSGISELEKTITLKAFSCNIGGFEYESRIIP